MEGSNNERGAAAASERSVKMPKTIDILEIVMKEWATRPG